MLHSNKSIGAMVSKAGFNLLINSGIQRYGLVNHLYWLSQGNSGGHLLWADKFPSKTGIEYSARLIEQGISDTIWLICEKP